MGLYVTWLGAIVGLGALLLLALVSPAMWILFALGLVALIGYAVSRARGGGRSDLDAPPGAPGEPLR